MSSFRLRLKFSESVFLLCVTPCTPVIWNAELNPVRCVCVTSVSNQDQVCVCARARVYVCVKPLHICLCVLDSTHTVDLWLAGWSGLG